MGDYFKRVMSETATRFWINNATNTEAKLAIEAGAIGCTQNPSYVWKMLDGSEDSELAKAKLKEIIKSEPNDSEALIKVQRELVANIAKHFYPMYEKSNGKLGYVSIQGSPIQEDAESIIRFARYNCSAAPNIMAKIPVTEEGLKAIGVLVKEGIPINATECMAVKQVLDVSEIYAAASGHMKNPAPMYFSLITGIFDEYLHSYVEKNHVDVNPDFLWQAGICVARKVHAMVKNRCYTIGFISGGARGLHHFTEMVGADATVTINWKGTADVLLKQDLPVVSRFHMQTPFEVEDALVEKLPDFRKAYFVNAIKPSEYEDFGPVVLFRSGFVSNWEKALEFVASLR
ncbi:putative transaldolase [uncultured spirochete]|uniref:Putative transaldolase n=1 Tax=uncultured spirochete TaxID=156406 RepID=A0A3P3XME8_9SPIR|nr:putative transaldolase [uncultured spirochete]